MRAVAVFAAVLALAPAAHSEEVATPQDEAFKIVSEGRILSSTPVGANPLGEMARPGIPPNGLRMHEIFVLHQNALYLCYLRAEAEANFHPYALCHGPE